MRIAVLSLLIFAAGAFGPWGSSGAAQAGSPAPAASPARPRDPIAALLNPKGPAPGDEDEPDTAGQPRTATDPDLDLTAPAPPAGPAVPFAPPPRSVREAPVNIDQVGQTPDGPPDSRAQAYDARIRASFAAAQSYQGPLDGGWTLSTRTRDYGLQIVDRRDRLEAVWRDLRRTGALDASGLVDDIQRSGGTLTIRLNDPTTVVATVTLHETPDGSWAGQMARGGETFPATLRRTSP